MSHLTLDLLGPMQVTLNNIPVKFSYDKVRALCAFLATESDRPHRREALAGLFWPNVSDADARRDLSQALFSLRQAIADEKSQPAFLIITREAIHFNRGSDHALDVAAFESLLAACDAHAHSHQETCAECAERWQQAVVLYRGDFLQQFSLSDSVAFEEWALVKREQLHRRALDGLVQLTRYHELREDYAAMQEFAARQLALEPWREEAHQQVMRALALSGQPGAALAQYETCRRVLADELGVEPSGETKKLYDQIRTGNWKLDVGHWNQSPISNVQTPTSNSQLPTHLTPFIGRERELAEIARVLADPAARLMTLVGIGGMGKTRLALQVAQNHREQFTHGVAFVPLAMVTASDMIVPAIADALGFVFRDSDDSRAQLVSYLREKQLLLVLDNLEHLLSDAKTAAFVDELLRNAPGVKVLATSREPLAMQSEWLFDVGGLGDQAVTLFEQSARRAQPGFQSCEDDRSSITRICDLVDGMPLGIELAASWVRVLACAEIAQEIERHLDFLTTSARDVPERHRSIRAVFDQSWRLLSEDERRALSRLSVFHGGFQRQAAEQIAGANLALVSALIAKSLVRRVDAGRYDLHELVRQYATARLAEDAREQADTLDRHCVFYLEQFAAQESALNSIDQSKAINEQSHEIGNVRAAWRRAVERGKFSLIGKTLGSFRLFYEVRGWFEQAIEQIELVVTAIRAASPTALPDLMGQLLDHQAWFRSRCGQYGAARALSRQGIALLRPFGPPEALSSALLFGAIIAYRAGDLSAAQQWADEGLATARAIRNDWMIAFGLCVQGIVAHVAGQHREAYDYLRAGLDGFRAIGNSHLIGLALNYLAPVAIDLGRLAEAQALLEESLALNGRTNDRWGLGTCYGNLGLVAQARGDLNQARSLFRQAIETFDELGARGYAAEQLVRLGEANAAMGDTAEAERIFRDAIRLASQVQATPSVVNAVVGLATLLAQSGEEQERLMEWLVVIEAHPATHSATRARAARLREKLAPQVSPDQMETIQRQTAALSLEQIVRQALT